MELRRDQRKDWIVQRIKITREDDNVERENKLRRSALSNCESRRSQIQK